MTDHENFEQDDLASLRALAARMPQQDHTWEQPPAGLWDRIAAEIAADDAPTLPTEPPAPSEPFAPTEPERSPGELVAPATVTDISSRRRVPWVLGVAAAVVLVVGAVVFVSRPSSDPPVLASARLERLGDSGSGDAELVEVDGTMRLRVATADLDSGEGFLEVWLINTEVTQLVSLGPVRADGSYEIPPGLDPADFPVVDVSVEPLDGDPTHSGDSVLRGQLLF